MKTPHPAFNCEAEKFSIHKIRSNTFCGYLRCVSTLSSEKSIEVGNSYFCSTDIKKSKGRLDLLHQKKSREVLLGRVFKTVLPSLGGKLLLDS